MKIIFTKGLLAGNVVDMAGDVIRIGRGEENELCLMTGGVSRNHGRLERMPDGSWKLVDLGSTNGIKVNGTKIKGEKVVTPDDDIEIGEQVMRFDPEPSDTISLPGEVSINPALDFKPLVFAEAPSDPGKADEDSSEKSSSSAEPELKDIFNGNSDKLFAAQEDGPGTAGETSAAAPPAGRRRFSNLLFYTILGALVVMVLSVMVKKFSAPAEKVPAKEAVSVDIPYYLAYERIVIDRDNVFRFSVTVEEKKAVVTVDDLKHRREIRREIDSPNGISSLRGKIKSSGVLQLASRNKSVAVGDFKVLRRLVFQEGKQVYEAELTGEFAPLEMERAEMAVSDFVEVYGLHTVSLTPEELMSQAEANLQKADDLFNNREAGLINLRDAVLRYGNAVSCLEQFSPKPRRWDYARKRLAEARKIREEKYKELIFEYNRLLKLREFDRLRGVIKQLMEITDPDSPQYEQARERLFKLDNISRKGR